VKVDLPVEARLTTYPGWWMRRPEGGEAVSERMAGVSTLTSKVAVGPRRSYTVVSALSGATVEMLRQAAPLYPPGVEERYLQLPPTLPQRVRDLAKEITGGYDNAYDKAAALERYLRRLSYNRTIEAPPSGRDVVDYFLFEGKEGYCDYFASAMVVMARAVGIPARLAVGYVGGEYREESEDYVVRRSASHAWVEIFFPLYGWVEFEPTPSQSLLARPRGEFEAGEGVVPGVGPGRPLEPFLDFPEYPGLFEPAPAQAAPWPLGAVLGVFIMASSVVLTSVYGLVRRRRWLALPPAERAYRGMASLSPLLGLRAWPSQTPLEYGSAVAERLPEEGESALHISGLFVRERFSQEGINEAEGQEALRSWHRLRWAASKALLGRARGAIGSAHELAVKGWRRLLRSPSPGVGAGVDRQPR
jgi:transglutaminase-like putative cysteine protease